MGKASAGMPTLPVIPPNQLTIASMAPLARNMPTATRMATR